MSTVSFPGLGLSVQVKPVAFRVFGWPIHWYGIIIACGFLLAVAYCVRHCEEFGVEEDDWMDILLYAVPLAIVGARAYYVIFYLDNYRRPDGSLDFAAMVRIWDGGLAIYGGILMAILVAVVCCKKRGIRFGAFADLGCQGLLIGQMIGRWGNFVNVEAYGRETTLPWRMGITDRVDGVVRYMEVHPTFLYESLWTLAGFLLLSQVVAKKRKFDGEVFCSYLAWYGLGRSWIEGLRTDSLYLFSSGLRVSQVLAVTMVVFSCIVLLLQRRRPQCPEGLWVQQVRAARAAEQTALQEPDHADPARSGEQSQELEEGMEQTNPQEEKGTRA